MTPKDAPNEPSGKDTRGTPPPLKRLIDLFKSLPGRRPDYEHLEKPKDSQTEEDYQKEQAEWLERVRARRRTNRKRSPEDD